MVVMLLAGAGIGLGIVLVVRALIPVRPDLPRALARIGGITTGIPSGVSAFSGPADGQAGFVEPLARTLGIGHLITPSVATDLRLVGRNDGSHVVRCLTAGIEGALLVPALLVVLALAGVSVPLEIPAALLLALGLGGAVVPNIALASEARTRRRSFNHALGAFLDLVAVNLAAGRGVEGALDNAAGAGRGWAFGEIRQALYRAKIMGDTPWSGLDQLGIELGVPDLRELAASVSLAGDNGAKIRTSLAAKAQALRVKGLAEVEAAAQSASERMSLPVILLLCGFVLFIGFPAIARVLEGV
ncbi:MAG: type II secretion system F family protein [Actinomycetota bacterium]|nr:type II secretion system F family protein [Actinomycetota bacterium]